MANEMPPEARELLTRFVPQDVRSMLRYWEYVAEEGQYSWNHDAPIGQGTLWLEATHDGRPRTYDEDAQEFLVGRPAQAFIDRTVSALRALT